MGLALNSCDKEEIIPFPEGTSTLRMMDEDNGRTLLSNDVYITTQGNFRSNDYLLFDMGAKNGISDIYMPDFVNMAQEVAVNPGHGYIICDESDVRTFPSGNKAIAQDAAVCRVYVDSWIQDKDAANIGAYVHFLLGKPSFSPFPDRGENIGTLTWDDNTDRSSYLSLPLPVSGPNDVEVEYLTFHYPEEEFNYTVSDGHVTFSLQYPPYSGKKDYSLRIRCNRVYIEVVVSTNRN